MRRVKTISIDQLKPGMFIIGMDQPWYRTPFLLHKRFIRHTKDIDLLRQHGIRELKIDTNQGLDVDPVPSEAPLPPSNAQKSTATPEPSHPPLPDSPEAVPQPASSEDMKVAQPQPPVTQQKTPTPSDAPDIVAAPQPSPAAQL